MESNIVKIKRTKFHSILNVLGVLSGRITSNKILNVMGLEQVYNGDFDVYAFNVIDKKKWVLTKLKYGI